MPATEFSRFQIFKRVKNCVSECVCVCVCVFVCVCESMLVGVNLRLWLCLRKSVYVCV